MTAFASRHAILKAARRAEAQQPRRTYKFSRTEELIWEPMGRVSSVPDRDVKVKQGVTNNDVLIICGSPASCGPRPAVNPATTSISAMPTDDAPKKTPSFKLHDFSDLAQNAGIVESPLEEGVCVEKPDFRPPVVRPIQSLLDRRRQSIAGRRCLAGPTAPCDAPQRAGGRPLSAKPTSTGGRPVSAHLGCAFSAESRRKCDRPVSALSSRKDRVSSAQANWKTSRPCSAKPSHANYRPRSAKPPSCPAEQQFADCRPASAKKSSPDDCIDVAHSCPLVKARALATAQGSNVPDQCTRAGQNETCMPWHALPRLEGG